MAMFFQSWIFHTHQIQPACRSCCPRRRTVLRFQNCNHIFRFESSLPDQQESPDQIAHHVMKESATPDFIDELVSLSPAPRRENLALVGNVALSASLWIHCRERSEIVLTLNQRRGCLHGFLIQRIRVVPNVADKKRRADGFPVNPVTISFRLSRLARMKLGGDLHCLQPPEPRKEKVHSGTVQI